MQLILLLAFMVCMYRLKHKIAQDQHQYYYNVLYFFAF